MIETELELWRPLNPVLYNALQSRFRSVQLANEGDRFVGSRVRDPLDPKRTLVQGLSWGEYYRICCPFCRDTRHRLWINHLYGQGNDNTGRPETWLAICYNEGCINDAARRWQLEDMIFGFRNRRDRNRTVEIAVQDTAPQVLSKVEAPGEIMPLDRLPPNHPALLYLINRRFDPQLLSQVYGVGYCLSVHDPRHRPLVGRIYIPIRMNGELVGWQGRYVGEADWKHVAKYYGLPGMHKRLMLYNYDVAKDWPFLVVVESANSVWRVGPPTVAILGKTLSGRQQVLLRGAGEGKPLILILDPDAREEMEGILSELVRVGKNPIVPIYLPAGYDPANYEHDAGVRMIQAAARQAGFTLPNW